MNNKEIIEAGFKALSEAYTAGRVQLKPSMVSRDLYFHVDTPEENQHRYTYALMSKNNEIIAICVFILSLETGKNDVAWFVREDYRGKGLGKKVVEKSFAEFKNGVKSAGAKVIVIVATIDEGNAPSIALGRRYVGGEEIIAKDDGTSIHSYLQICRFSEQ